jgi:iron transport multicopper oxidase
MSIVNPQLVVVFLCLNVHIFVESKLLTYEFNVKYISGSPDGVFKSKILSINGLFPGPTITGDVGDILQVTVHNNIQNGQNTSIHWHGIHQKGTPTEDGTSHISQCPLKNGNSQVYTFPLTASGTYWYHAHEGSQYTEGLWGTLIVRNLPEVYTYDEEIVLTLNDWYHRTAIENEHWHLSMMSRGVPPYPDTGMINGRGRYPCDYALRRNFNCTAEEQRRHIFNVKPGKTYRIRVINVAAVAAFKFSIDGHILQTIEVDGTDVKTPVPVHAAVIGAAQRYSFLVTMNQSPSSKHLIRANVMTERLMLIENENINPYPEALIADVTAVLNYHDGKKPEFDTEPHDYTVIVPPVNLTDAIWLDENLLTPHDGHLAPVQVDQEFTLTVTFSEDHEGLRRGSFNFTPFRLTHGRPLLSYLYSGDELPVESFPLYVRKGDVVQLVINNPFLGPHPFHLHGHSFWVMGTGQLGEGDYNPGVHNLILDGARRDTFLIQQESWGVIRFVADNPGLWTFHCHIDWHNLSGMALTFVVEPEAYQNATIPAEAIKTCSAHGINI